MSTFIIVTVEYEHEKVLAYIQRTLPIMISIFHSQWLS